MPSTLNRLKLYQTTERGFCSSKSAFALRFRERFLPISESHMVDSGITMNSRRFWKLINLIFEYTAVSHNIYRTPAVRRELRHNIDASWFRPLPSAFDIALGWPLVEVIFGTARGCLVWIATRKRFSETIIERQQNRKSAVIFQEWREVRRLSTASVVMRSKSLWTCQGNSKDSSSRNRVPGIRCKRMGTISKDSDLLPMTKTKLENDRVKCRLFSNNTG